MFPFILHWYLIFGVIWNVQSRDVLSHNRVQSFTVWITSGDKPRREKTIYLNTNGDVTAIHYPVGSTSERVDTFINSYTRDGRLLNVMYRDVTVKFTWNGTVLSGKDEFSKDQKVQISHTDYITGNHNIAAYTGIIDAGTGVYIKDTVDVNNRVITESHYSGHDFYGKTIYTYDVSCHILTMEISHPGSPGKEVHQYQYNDQGLVTGETIDLPGKSTPEVKSYEYVYY